MKMVQNRKPTEFKISYFFCVAILRQVGLNLGNLGTSKRILKEKKRNKVKPIGSPLGKELFHYFTFSLFFQFTYDFPF